MAENHTRPARLGAAAALLAACFFGAGAPLSKLLLEDVSPLLMAGLLYTGSFIGLTALGAARRFILKKRAAFDEPGLKGWDYAYLTVSIMAGGVAAPILMMYGLLVTAGSVASLLLNIEGILTALIASLVFRENVGKRVWAAAVVMLAAGSVLTYSPDEGGWSLQAGSVLVMLSALMWAVDNNITRRLSHRDPFVIARYKGFFAGAANGALAIAFGAALPASGPVFSVVLLGALGYGASLVLFIYALRNLGASRTGVYFGAAPFIGVAVSVAALGEPVTAQVVLASALMAAGLWFILKEYHAHEHTHEAVCHEHSHYHDEHHAHGHEGLLTEEPHCHEHTHGGMTHSHAHVPDLHHYHDH